jgi:alkanesulfonate monooxygenase SsuD/methylene tetrahydromethanopterin reductase-like flavin-dependent oxidoreductase (luciferase family)
MKRIWSEPRVTFTGQFARIAEAGGVRPQPVRNHIPIWIGGHSDAALRRVVAVGDGWHPLGLRPPATLDPGELAERVKRLEKIATTAARDPAEITVAFKGPVRFDAGASASRTPLTGSPSQIVEDLHAYVRAGASHFVLDFSVPTVGEMLEVLDRFASEVRPHVRE